MIKKLLLIAALVPIPATAHDFNQHQWLQRWLDNRIDIGNCLKLSETDIPAFRAQCDLHAMGTIENKEFAVYQAERLVHPLDNDMQFILDHYPDAPEDWIWGIYRNVEITHAFHAAIINMYIVEGLTRNDK